MSDMARQIAAGGGASASAPDDVMAAMGQSGMPEPAGPVPMESLEAAMAQLEGALEGISPDKQAQIRTHLDAIREVVGQAETEGEGMESKAMEPPPTAGEGEGGLTEKLGGLA